MPVAVVFAVCCFFPNLPSGEQVNYSRNPSLLFVRAFHPGCRGNCAEAPAAQGPGGSCRAECSCTGQVLVPELFPSFSHCSHHS